MYEYDIGWFCTMAIGLVHTVSFLKDMADENFDASIRDSQQMLDQEKFDFNNNGKSIKQTKVGDHRKFMSWKNVISISICRLQFYIGFRFDCRY